MGAAGLYEFLHNSSHRYTDKVFVKSGGCQWTYGSVEAMAELVTDCLWSCGIKKGERAVIFCENSVQYITALFGIFGSGAIAVPVNPLKMADIFRYIINKSTPSIILVSSASISRLKRIEGLQHIRIINIDDLLNPNQWCIGYSGSRTSHHGHEFATEMGEHDMQVDQADDAIILFTSGTTAYPKGVTLTHGNIIANTAAIMDYLKLTSEDSILMTLPFTYSYGNSVLLTHTMAGAEIVIDNDQAYPFKILEQIKENRVTGFSTVGSYINLMLKCMKNLPEGDFLKSLRYITFAGESTCNEDVIFIHENFRHIKPYVMYGQTEASARLSYLEPDMLPDKIGSVGKGLNNITIDIVDDNGRSLKPGEIGEIIVKGPSIMRGYWNDPEATAAVLRDGWLYTGDTAVMDEEGFVYIKGRKDDIIKHMGHRLSPVEIEGVINSCPFVRESAVTEGIRDSVPVIMAFVVAEAGCCTDEIKRYVNPRLPVYMRPQVYELIDSLPRTESGKIRRSILRDKGKRAEVS